jgi:hypothetical protein
MPTATLITCSFQGDLDVCRLLCESIDRHAGPDFEHRLYVPRRDLALFADLAGPRRRIETQESLLPRWLLKAPLPGPQWRARLRLPRRNVYLSPWHGIVRGWIAQQVMKISATLRAPCEIVAHIDSDAALVQPLRIEHLIENGKARFYAGPVVEKLQTHALWAEAGARLIGLPPGDYYRADYIDSVVVWRQSVVEAMTARIAEVTGRSWTRALAATPHFSEYMLYGLFAEHGAGLEAAGLAGDARSLCLTRWSGALDDAAAEADFLARARADQILCCVQSTIAISLEARRRIYEAAGEAIAAKKTGAERRVA